MGKEIQLSFNKEDEPIFELSAEVVISALTNYSLEPTEKEALVYVGGYILRKLKKMHTEPCDKCDKFSSKITVNCQVI